MSASIAIVGGGLAAATAAATLRGDVPGRVFRAYWVAGGTVVAAMHVNDGDASDSLRSAVGQPVAAVGHPA